MFGRQFNGQGNVFNTPPHQIIGTPTIPNTPGRGAEESHVRAVNLGSAAFRALVFERGNAQNNGSPMTTGTAASPPNNGEMESSEESMANSATANDGERSIASPPQIPRYFGVDWSSEEGSSSGDEDASSAASEVDRASPMTLVRLMESAAAMERTSSMGVAYPTNEASDSEDGDAFSVNTAENENASASAAGDLLEEGSLQQPAYSALELVGSGLLGGNAPSPTEESEIATFYF